MLQRCLQWMLLVVCYVSAIRDEKCCTAGDCAAKLWLPDAYNATLRLGDGLRDGETPPTLEMLHAQGELQYVTYDKEPHEVQTGGETALGAKFRNFRRETLNMMWDNGSPDGVYSGAVNALSRTATLTYHGHSFHFVSATTGKKVMTIKMDRTRNLYFIPPLKDDLEILSSADYKHAIAERQFMEEYRKRTGTPWLSFYSKDGPRPPPVLTMWPTAYIGQVCCDAGPHRGLDF